MDQPEGLISVLIDDFADEASRDDAAMDLSMFIESSVEDALIRVASISTDINQSQVSAKSAIFNFN